VKWYVVAAKGTAKTGSYQVGEKAARAPVHSDDGQ
jgi:hypothetical protein